MWSAQHSTAALDDPTHRWVGHSVPPAHRTTQILSTQRRQPGWLHISFCIKPKYRTTWRLRDHKAGMRPSSHLLLLQTQNSKSLPSAYSELRQPSVLRIGKFLFAVQIVNKNERSSCWILTIYSYKRVISIPYINMKDVIKYQKLSSAKQHVVWS